MFSQPQALPSPFLTPEVRSSRDEQQPAIGPNLAGDANLCEKLTRHLVSDYWYPYLQMQMKFWPVWDQMDRAWRANLEAIDLDLMNPALDKKNFNIASSPNVKDGFTLKISPTDFHRQLDSLLKVCMNISWEEGMPVSAVKPEYVFETLYNPTQQTVDAVNEILLDTAHESDLYTEYKINLASFLKYGHAWGMTDLKRTFEDVQVRYSLGSDMTQVQAGIQFYSQRYQQRPQFDRDQNGIVAIFNERRVKEFVTGFKHLDVDAVFTDLTISCRDMEIHPCPFVRQHLAEHQLEKNAYDPATNPFGWVNIPQALETTKGHYALNAEDEGVLRARLKERFGLTDQNILKAEHTRKQLWTAFPMVRVAPGGALDTGDGVDCPMCAKSGKVQPPPDATGAQPDPVKCPNCNDGKARPIARRYIAQFYGAMRGPQTCIRLQSWPESMKIPLLFAADMVEDTACAIPVCKGEVAWNDLMVLAKSENHHLHSKDMAVHRGWKVKVGCVSSEKDFDKPNTNIEFENDPNEVQRIDSATFDETITVAPYSQERRERIKSIFGATDQLIGEIEAGRRSATELGNAIDASKNPIVVMNDGYNKQMPGRWAQQVVTNLDLWGDRDWIRVKTGREFFGKLRFNTAVGQEFIRKLMRVQNERSLMEMLPNLAPVFPGVAQIIPQLLTKLFKDMGMDDVDVPDGGLMKAQQAGNRIVSKILGDGQAIPPGMNDPDEIYIAIFTDAIRAAQEDPQDYWYGKCGETLPLLIQRLQMQQQISMQKQAQQMQQQMMMQAMQAHAQALGSSKGKEQGAPRDGKKGGKVAGTAGSAMQNAQSGQGSQAA